jgi:carboxypeptidase Q
MLDSIGVDTSWLQPMEVPYWKRGTIADAKLINSQTMGDVGLSIAALGNAAATPKLGLTAEVIEVKSIRELEALGTAKVKGKIVFFNRPMDVTRLNTFHAYGAAVDQRTAGPRKASALGAVATLVRSMTVKYDDIPHSGVTVFKKQKPIPAAGLGLKSADLLSALLKKEPKLKLYLNMDCKNMGRAKTYNVIADIKGSTYPDKIILVGGHLDSWDIGEGAHDDGAGVVQAMEVMHLFKRLGIRPKYTIRCVLFANEETGLFGASHYAKWAKKNKLKHLAAIESDAGGHTPDGFMMDAMPSIAKARFDRVKTWRSVLGTFGLRNIQAGGSAADISRLKNQGVVLFGYRPDSQRYFDYHHAATDVFETVNRRELVLGAAGMAALVYLIDNYGF